MKLAILSICLVGQILAAPSRFRRDAPVLPAWDIPTLGFEGRSADFFPHSENLFYRADVAPHEDYGVPHEDYGVPHEEYGPPPPPALREVVTEHYCPEEDIVPPFAPAPPAPGAFPLPVPVLRKELPYEAPAPIPHEEYGPPEIPHEEYGPPPPPIPEGPYPAPTTTTTEAPTTPLATVPPPPPIIDAPYPPAPVRLAPYPAPTLPPTTLPPTTLPPTTKVPTGPYPSAGSSKYEHDSGLSNFGTGSFVETSVPFIPVPAVRAPVNRISYIEPKITITKKVIGFPIIGALKQKLFRRFIH